MEERMRKTIFVVMAVLTIFAIVSCDNGTTTPKKWTVTFDSKGGSDVAQIKDVKDGSKITAPTPPTKLNSTFAGWYKEDACTNEWKFATDKVTKNITLYAKWTAVGGGDEPELYDTSIFPGTVVNLGDFSLSNSDKQKGWLTNGVDDITSTLTADQLKNAQMLILDLSKAPVGGMQLIWQGNGNSWGWGQTVILGDTGEIEDEEMAMLLNKDSPELAEIGLTDLKDVDTILAINLAAALTDYEDKFVSDANTQIKIIIGYYAPDIAGLGLLRAYLLTIEEGGGEGEDPTNPENPGYTVPTYPPLTSTNDIVETIGLANGWSAIFQFVLPEGRVWEDYKELTAQHKIADVTTAVRARMWGNYVPKEIANAHFGQYNGQNFAVVASWPSGNSGAWIWDNTYAGVTAANTLFSPAPTNDTWFTVKYNISGTGAHAQWDNNNGSKPGGIESEPGRKPQAEYKGPFYIGVGLSTNSTTDPVISQIKNVTLVGYDADIPDVIGVPLYYKNGDTLYRAFVGQLDGEKNATTGLYPNLNNGMPSWKIDSGETTIKAAAITASFVPGAVENVKITFNANYGASDPDFAAQPADTDVTIVKGEKLTSTPILERKGYTFLGWFKEAAATNKIDADDTYSAATTLFAGWKEFVVPSKVTVDDPTKLAELVKPAWGAKEGTGDNEGYIIMASAAWNTENGANGNDSLINISFPADLDTAFNMFRIYYDYKQIEAPSTVPDGWVVDAGAVAKKFNTGDNAGNPGSYFSFNQSGGVLDRTFNANVTTTSGMSIQINKGDDENNKQKRDGLVYGIKITKIEFVYRISTVVEGAALQALVTPAWGAKKNAEDYVIMASDAWNGAKSDPEDEDSPLNGASANDSLLNISFPANLDAAINKFIITYSYKQIEAPELSADDIADGWKLDAAAIAKKYNSGDNASNPSNYFSWNQSGGTLDRDINANVTLTSGMSFQINKGDDSSNKQKRAGLVYGIKITKIEFYFEAP